MFVLIPVSIFPNLQQLFEEFNLQRQTLLFLTSPYWLGLRNVWTEFFLIF